MKAKRSRYHIEALARGLAVLGVFTPQEPALPLAEIARRARLTPSTAVRFVTTLLALGFLEQLPESRRYALSLGTLKLGYTALASLDLRSLARPTLERLFAETGETVNLSSFDGQEVVHVDRLSNADLMSVNLPVGSRLPMHASAMAKAIAAHLPPAERERQLARVVLVPLGPNTHARPERFTEELRTIRSVGYATSNQELMPGLRSVAAPILDREARPRGAIGIAVAAVRVTLAELRTRYAPLVIGAAAEVSAKLRHRYNGGAPALPHSPRR